MAQLGRGASDDHPRRPRPSARRCDRRGGVHSAEGTALDPRDRRATRGPLAAHAGPGHHRLRRAAAQGHHWHRSTYLTEGCGMTTLLAVESLTRRFGGLVAVNAVTLDLRRGEV